MPKKSTRPGFVQATSHNLPKVDCFMVCNFYQTVVFPEGRNVKTLRSGRASYGDNAIGYVELQKADGKCEIWADITPEHKVTAKPYPIHCIINEKMGTIEKAKCEAESCPAKEDCCKHAVAFIEWLQRKSLEPSVTSVDCYWNRSTLGAVGSSLRFLTMNDIQPQKKVTVPEEKVKKFFDEACAILREKCPQKLPKQLSYRPLASYAVHHLLMEFKRTVSKELHNPDSFLGFCTSMMNEETCKLLAKSTSDQAGSSAWFSLRCSRVTASTIYEASKCTTPDGSLVNRILGIVKVKETAPMLRGRILEATVLKNLKAGTTLKRTGFVMKPEEPVFGASPDAILRDCVIEVKCPATDASFRTYFQNNDPASKEPANKHKGQLHLQMIFCDRKKGLFLVADPEFEKNGKVECVPVAFDEAFAQSLIKDAKRFWKEYIYPVLYESV